MAQKKKKAATKQKKPVKAEKVKPVKKPKDELAVSQQGALVFEAPKAEEPKEPEKPVEQEPEKPVEQEAESEERPQEKPVRPRRTPEQLYTDVADAVHQTAANVIALLTEDRIRLEESKLGRLNTAGAHLLQKYDKDGRLLEYSPELAYVLTLADIGTQVYADIKRERREREKQQEKAAVIEVTQQPKEPENPVRVQLPRARS